MNNLMVRYALVRSGLKNYELAEMLGIAPESWSRKLRYEMPEEEQRRIVEVIEGKVKDGKEKNV